MGLFNSLYDMCVGCGCVYVLCVHVEVHSYACRCLCTCVHVCRGLCQVFIVRVGSLPYFFFPSFFKNRISKPGALPLARLVS